MRFTPYLLASVVASMSLAACGGDDGGTVTAIDAAVSIDAPNTDIDAPTATCTAAATYADPISQAFAEFDQNAMSGAVTITAGGALNADAALDAVQVELYNTYAPFGTSAAPGTIAPGTYELTGEQLNYATCGVCIRMFTDLDPGTGASTDQYFATGGTVTITANGNAVGAPFDVTLTNVTMTHVTIDPSTFESTPVGDGCNSTVGGQINVAAMTAPMAKLTHGTAANRFGAASKR